MSALRFVGGRPWERVALTFVVALIAVPLCLQVAAWDTILSPIRTALYTQWPKLDPVVVSWSCAIWIHGMGAVGWITIILSTGLLARGRILEEQSLLDGSRSAVFRRVTLPLLLPMYAASLMWTMVMVARDITVVDIYQIGTYAEQVYLGYALNRFSWLPQTQLDESLIQWLGSFRQGLLIAWLVGSALLMFAILLRRPAESEAIRLEPIRGGGRSWILGCGVVAVLVIVVIVPVAAAVIQAGTHVAFEAGVPRRVFSARHVIQSFSAASKTYREPGDLELLDRYWCRNLDDGRRHAGRLVCGVESSGPMAVLSGSRA